MTQQSTGPGIETPPGAWPALFAMAAGFFMIMIDTTIVSVSIPAIMSSLHADVTGVMWVSSAYLLTYAIPLLITGRLGDRYGPRRVYLVGLGIFTLSSLWCGLSGSIESLVAARAVQGVGAALMSPQTMAVITRLFPPQKRGMPMGLWGATASVAGLMGPLLGGVLVDSVGWQWIFFVNVPIGAIAIAAVWLKVPKLETHAHSFDWVGVALSAVGLTMVVFGLQEGQAKSWPGWIFALIVAGVVVMGLFVWQQSRNTREPLMPLQLFGNRNFAAANVGIFVMGAVVVAFSFPLMLYLQSARGLSPTMAALVSLPSSVVSLAGAPLVGRAADSRSTKVFAVPGFLLFAAVLFAQALLMRPTIAWEWMMVPSVFMGASAACIWGPLSMSATRDLPRQWAGAGSGVYNATRQLGSVLGSAAIATIIEWQLGRQLPGGHSGTVGEGSHSALPDVLRPAFSAAMRHATFFPAAMVLLGAVAASFLVKPNFLRQEDRSDGAAGVDGQPSAAVAGPEPSPASRPTADAPNNPAAAAPVAAGPARHQAPGKAPASGPVRPRRALDE